MPRFVIAAEGVDGDRVTLTGSDARHAVRVLRLAIGDALECSLPDGRWATAILVEVDPARVVATVTGICAASSDPAHRLVIAQALAKGDVLDRIIQHVSELGATEVLPFIAERSVGAPPDDRRAPRVARWRRIAEESCKQCGRTVPLIVRDIGALADVTRLGASGAALLALLAEGECATEGVASAVAKCPGAAGIVAVVGPEGGLSPSEREALRAAGALGVTLGPRVLRCETAAVAACALIVDALAGGVR
jgi:16S rRNA (uracil1498-N3)-methyltransferase